MNTIKFNRHESKLLTWLQKALSSDDSRPVLQQIHVNENSIVAADGWRAHWIHKSEIEPLAEMQDTTMSLGKLRSGENIVEPTVYTDGAYPDVRRIIPNAPGAPMQGPVVFEIAVDSKMLVDALQGLNAPVRLRFYGKNEPLEVMGTIETKYNGDWTDSPVYALIMPMDLSATNEDPWRPV